MKKLLRSLFILLFIATTAFAQDRTITGTVTSNEDGLPMPGVSVRVRGTNLGVSTGADGKYLLSVPSSATTLEFSSIGFISQSVAISATNVMNVALVVDSKVLGEVIITGYTTQAKEKSAISSSLVTSDDIKEQPITNINDVLQGKAAGLTVTSTSGQPGAAADVRIRGVGSISAGSSPLYVIDGIIVERGQFARDVFDIAQGNDILSNLNPNDIENVTILKDATALALYGSRGGNGVIVITTKKGKQGTSTVNFSAQVGSIKPSFGNWEMMSAQEAYNYERAVLAVNGIPQATIDANYPTSLLDKTFNWVDAAFQNGNSQNYDLSVRGGNEKTTHAFSFGYFDQDGTVPNSNFKRFTSNINVETQTTNWLKLGLQMNTSFSNAHNADGGGYFSSPILSSLINSPLWVYPYQNDGSLFTGTEANYGGITGDNFLYSNELNYNKLKQFRGIGKLFAEAKITNWLNAKQTVAMDLINAAVKNFFDPTTGNGLGSTPATSGELVQAQSNIYTFTSQSSLFGGFRLENPKHEFDYLALMEYQRYNNTNFYADGLGSADPKLQELGTFGTPSGVGGGQSEYAFFSYLAQLSYTYNSRYTLTSSFRRDGSSRFGINNRFAPFYSIGASWRIIEESFMKNQSIFSDLRLRASYGTSGVAGFGNYEAQQLYTYSGISYNGTAGSAPSTPGNIDLTWEKNKQFDIGLEFGILKGRLSGTLDIYRRVGEDLLQNVPVSRTSGFTTAQKNIGSVENKGIEVSLSSINFRNNNRFNWTTDFNFSYNTNKVLALNNGEDIIGGTLGITREQYALNSWFLPVWAGVDPQNGDPLWYLADGVTTTNSYTIASRNENRKIVGSSLPKYTFGLNNRFEYKGVELSFLWYASVGAKVYNQTRSFIDSDGLRWGWGYSAEANDNFWTTPGQAADRPKPIPGGNANSPNPSTRWIENNDFLRLRNITLGYALPSSIATKMKVSGLRVFVTGINLITITNYKGVDPEGALSGNEVFKYPVSKSITAGINLTL